MVFDSANIRLLTTLLFLLIMQQSQSGYRFQDDWEFGTERATVG